jgi:N12 class adenine-specific DNA methylase
VSTYSEIFTRFTPNNLAFQMGAEFLRAYPDAKILITRKEDFQKENRRRMIARMATGDYDCIIIGHTQFQRIAISPDRQRAMIEEQAEQLVEAINQAREEAGKNWSIKQMESRKKKLLQKIEELNNEEIKDDAHMGNEGPMIHATDIAKLLPGLTPAQ